MKRLGGMISPNSGDLDDSNRNWDSGGSSSHGYPSSLLKPRTTTSVKASSPPPPSSESKTMASMQTVHGSNGEGPDPRRASARKSRAAHRPAAPLPSPPAVPGGHTPTGQHPHVGSPALPLFLDRAGEQAPFDTDAELSQLRGEVGELRVMLKEALASDGGEKPPSARSLPYKPADSDFYRRSVVYRHEDEVNIVQAARDAAAVTVAVGDDHGHPIATFDHPDQHHEAQREVLIRENIHRETLGLPPRVPVPPTPPPAGSPSYQLSHPPFDPGDTYYDTCLHGRPFSPKRPLTPPSHQPHVFPASVVDDHIVAERHALQKEAIELETALFREREAVQREVVDRDVARRQALRRDVFDRESALQRDREILHREAIDRDAALREEIQRAAFEREMELQKERDSLHREVLARDALQKKAILERSAALQRERDELHRSILQKDAVERELMHQQQLQQQLLVRAPPLAVHPVLPAPVPVPVPVPDPAALLAAQREAERLDAISRLQRDRDAALMQAEEEHALQLHRQREDHAAALLHHHHHHHQQQQQQHLQHAAHHLPASREAALQREALAHDALARENAAFHAQRERELAAFHPPAAGPGCPLGNLQRERHHQPYPYPPVRDEVLGSREVALQREAAAHDVLARESAAFHAQRERELAAAAPIAFDGYAGDRERELARAGLPQDALAREMAVLQLKRERDLLRHADAALQRDATALDRKAAALDLLQREAELEARLRLEMDLDRAGSSIRRKAFRREAEAIGLGRSVSEMDTGSALGAKVPAADALRADLVEREAVLRRDEAIARRVALGAGDRLSLPAPHPDASATHREAVRRAVYNAELLRERERETLYREILRRNRSSGPSVHPEDVTLAALYDPAADVASLTAAHLHPKPVA